MANHYNKKNQQTVLEVIIIGIFKGLWLLIKWIFSGFKLKKSSGGLAAEDRNFIVLRRQEIEELLKSENPIELKHAVMEADKLVDFILRTKGYQGETLADRLRSSERFINPGLYNEIWEGHKIRNQIAHEHELKLANQELRIAAGKLLKLTREI